ncbi:MAG: GtrA family protein [Oceanococcus sp.]
MTTGRLPAQFVRFLGVGGSATAFMYVLLAILVELLHITPVWASAIAYSLSAVFNYWANYHFTFASQALHRRAMPRFIAIATCGLAINAAIMWLLIHPVAWHYVPAQLVATVAVLLWNFFTNRQWTYRSEPPAAQDE